MGGSWEKHQRLQRTLVDRLQNTGYSPIYQNIEYSVKIGHRTIEGEVDVLAKSPYGRWHFYELKSGKGKQLKAQQQYDRWKLTHPSYEGVGVFVSPYKVKRLQ